ncbi:MAG TPA: response regulator transcription factor [Gemmatimonadales bacterium]|nr:response regulator transcription factor [Gemmatimonadales bacterium]
MNNSTVPFAGAARSAMQRRVLVIEDDHDLAELIRLHLRDQGLDVVVCSDGVAGLKEALGRSWDLLVLDLRLPGIDGLEVCRRVRLEGKYIPILMLTARSTEMDRVLGLETGADDYLTKPFSVIEFIARVKAILRRVQHLAAGAAPSLRALQIGEIEIDLDRRTVRRGGRPVELTAREFDLLVHFAQHPGRVYTRAQLLDQVWGLRREAYEHTVSSHINRLRAKIEPSPATPRYLLTIWGVGYRFASE